MGVGYGEINVSTFNQDLTADATPVLAFSVIQLSKSSERNKPLLFPHRGLAVGIRGIALFFTHLLPANQLQNPNNP